MQVDCVNAEELVDVTYVTVGQIVIEVGVFSSSVYGAVFRALNPQGSCWTTIEEAVNEVAPPPGTYPMLIAAEAVPNGVPVSIQISFSINGVLKWTPYAESLDAGLYTIVLPSTIIINGNTYTLLGNNEFTISHPQNSESYFKASYFTELPPPSNGDEWAVMKPVHIFDDFEVTSESTEVLKSVTRTIGKVDTSVLVGGKLDYSISYTQGNTFPNPNVRVFFNDMELVSDVLALNGSISGTIDLTGLIKESNTIKIQVESTILMWAECFFDIWVTFGYSKEPATDPVGQRDWMAWLKENLLIVGIVGVGALLLFTSRGPSITIIQPKNS